MLRRSLFFLLALAPAIAWAQNPQQQDPQPQNPDNSKTYTAISAQYRSGIDDPIVVAPNDPMTTCVTFSEEESCEFTVPFTSGMTRRDIANNLADQIKKKWPDHADDVSANGATVIVKGTSQAGSEGTPDDPKESSDNHNRPWLSAYTKTVGS